MGSIMNPRRPHLPTGLYAITDAAFGDPVSLGRELYGAGSKVVQLRAKGWEPALVARAARALLATAREADALLIVNDHVDVAIDVGAHGVHLGLDDEDPRLARGRLPESMLLGLSTRTLAEVEHASEYAHYLRFRPALALRVAREPSCENRNGREYRPAGSGRGFNFSNFSPSTCLHSRKTA